MGLSTIADTGNNQVLVELPVSGGYTTFATITGLNPQGCGVDASGNIYVADKGNNRLVKEILFTGVYTPATIATTSPAYDVPFGVAVDADGNVYYGD